MNQRISHPPDRCLAAQSTSLRGEWQQPEKPPEPSTPQKFRWLAGHRGVEWWIDLASELS